MVFCEISRTSNLHHPGIVACVWFIAFAFLVYDTPACHPRITVEEKTYIERARGTQYTVSQYKQNNQGIYLNLVTHFDNKWTRTANESLVSTG